MTPASGDMSLSTEGAESSFLTFRLENQVFGLPITTVRQIIEMVTITPLPQVLDTIEGVINYRGAMIPVADLRYYLGMSKTPRRLHTPIIITSLFDRQFGLIVDEVLDVLKLPSGQIVQPKDMLPDKFTKIPLLKGILKEGKGIVMLLSLEELLKPAQARRMFQAIQKRAKQAEEEAAAQAAADKEPAAKEPAAKAAVDEEPAAIATVDNKPVEEPAEPTQPEDVE